LRIRILATLYDIRTKLAREVLAELREQFSSMLMDATINFNTKLKEAASFGQPITEYDAASKGFKDFHKLARELMGPAPRLTLDLPSRAVVAAEDYKDSYASDKLPIEAAIARAQSTVEETLETIRDMEADTEWGSEEAPSFGEPNSPMIVPSQRRSNRMVSKELQTQVETLARRADEVKAAAQKNLGITLPARSATTAQKIQEFYGVRQVPEGLLFVAHFPNARSVGIAGDFNDWTPMRMVNDASGAGDTENTFRALVTAKPGRYRYRLVVDGRWQADPHNVCSEPNPFGELDSVVQVM
jgi:hypothetical protein